MSAVSYSRFLQLVRTDQVAKAVVTPGQQVAVSVSQLRDGRTIEATLPRDYQQALAAMQEHAVEIRIAAPGSGPDWTAALPFFLLVVVWLVLFASMKRGGWWRPPGGSRTGPAGFLGSVGSPTRSVRARATTPLAHPSPPPHAPRTAPVPQARRRPAARNASAMAR